MQNFKRIFVIVLDSLGIGAMPDSPDYGDRGVDTLGHIAERTEQLKIPNLQKLGLANLCSLKQVEPVDAPLGVYARLNEASKGKDTMTGHWEMMGLYVTKPFITFTDHGFPPELIRELEERTGRKIIGNKSASGTEILDELGEEEIEKGHLIVYTSADSVLQICGNEETMGLDTLYHYCEIARELTMRDEWKVGRVIARPYTGKKKGEFRRTANRHDYALKPFGKTVLNALQEQGYDVISVGKINDIFGGEGVTESNRSRSSVHGMEQTIEIAGRDFCGLCYVNLVDFDALWGHRRDVAGYAAELEKFDEKLGILLDRLGEEDLLILTADHGNDPTYSGTDHTREAVPFVAYSPRFACGGKLEEQPAFAVIGATIAENFQVSVPEGCIGESILQELTRISGRKAEGKMEDNELIRLAREARKKAYAPYSNFQVGAALYTRDGQVYLGCNVENASYGASNCAERTAVFKAVSDGVHDFDRIAIVGGSGEDIMPECYPCGICRQVLSEFCDPESFRILVEDSQGKAESCRLAELLPRAFGNE